MATRPTLFAFLDDHSRLLTGYRWAHAEDTLRLEAAPRRGIESRGLPEAVYLDNGRRVAGLRFRDPRVHALLAAIPICRLQPDGFANCHLRKHQQAYTGTDRKFYRPVDRAEQLA